MQLMKIPCVMLYESVDDTDAAGKTMMYDLGEREWSCIVRMCEDDDADVADRRGEALVSEYK